MPVAGGIVLRREAVSSTVTHQFQAGCRAGRLVYCQKLPYGLLDLWKSPPRKKSYKQSSNPSAESPKNIIEGLDLIGMSPCKALNRMDLYGFSNSQCKKRIG